jgi:hypothetical protein
MHFAYYAESADGEVGVCYVEVRADLVVRQIWEHGGHLYWCDATGHKDERHGFTDQPEWLDGLGADDLRTVDPDVFKGLWQRAGGPRLD